MSKQRSINTKLWSDNWVRETLNPLDRYLFLYFLTNEHTNLSGIYELSLSQMAFETGLDREELSRSMLPKLEPKIMYKKGWVIIPNFAKHQNQNSPKIQVGMERELSNVPQEIKDIAIGYGYGIDTVSHSNPNLNSNLTLTKPNLTLESTPAQEANKFFSSEDVRGNVINHLINQGVPEQTLRQEIKKFVLYWTEPNSTGKKQRWQTERTFEIRRRISTWLSRSQVKPSKINIPTL